MSPVSLSALNSLAGGPDDEEEDDELGPGAMPPAAAGGPAPIPPSLQGTGGAPGGDVAPDPDMARWVNDLRISKLKQQGFSPADIALANAGAAHDMAAATAGPGQTPVEAELENEDIANRHAHASADLAQSMSGQMNDIADINATRGAKRNFLPDVYNWWQEQNKAAIDKATAPALAEATGALNRTALENSGRVAAANAAAGAKFNRPPSETAKDLLTSISDLVKSGTFGVDRSGHPLPPPQAVQEQVTAALHKLIGGGGAGAQNGVLTPDDLQEYVDAHPGSTLDDAKHAALSAGYTIR